MISCTWNMLFWQFEENAAECRTRCPRNFERLLAINLLLCDFSLKRITVLCHSTLSGVAKKTLWKRWIFINGQSEWEWTAFKSWIFWKTSSLISRNSIRYSPPPPPPTTNNTRRSYFRALSKALLVWSWTWKIQRILMLMFLAIEDLKSLKSWTADILLWQRILCWKYFLNEEKVFNYVFVWYWRRPKKGRGWMRVNFAAVNRKDRLPRGGCTVKKTWCKEIGKWTNRRRKRK